MNLKYFALKQEKLDQRIYIFNDGQRLSMPHRVPCLSHFVDPGPISNRNSAKIEDRGGGALLRRLTSMLARKRLIDQQQTTSCTYCGEYMSERAS